VDHNELDLVETRDLLDALSRRNKAILVVEMREVGDESDGAAVWYRGGWIAAGGSRRSGSRCSRPTRSSVTISGTTTPTTTNEMGRTP
jgi:hypothetical protein